MAKTIERYAMPMILDEIRKEVLSIFADEERRNAYIKEIELAKRSEPFHGVAGIKREIVFHLFWLIHELFTASLVRMTASIIKH